MVGKMAVSDKVLIVTFNANQEPQFKFSGDWNIRNLGRVRSLLLRSYKHYMREIIKANLKGVIDERSNE